MKLTDSITTIKGIGEKTALLFSKASVFCVNDLLHYFPRNYQKMPVIKSIADIKDNELSVIKATVVTSPQIVSSRSGKKILSFRVKDNLSSNYSIKISYFNMPYLKNKFIYGHEFIFYGLAKNVKNELSLTNPKLLSEEEYEAEKGVLTPLYPLVKGLNNKLVQKSIKVIFNNLNDNKIDIKDYLPEEYRIKYKLLDIKEALSLIHFPNDIEEVYKARRRLAFDEFFFFMLKINSLKSDKGKQINNYPVKDFDIIDNIVSKLPFELTNGQSEALKDIKNDMSSGYLMNRLIQGDVGCGKTIIAILSCIMVINKGFQAVIMAPTEVLARQHYKDITDMVSKYQLDFIKPALLVGSLKASEKKDIQRKIKLGEVNFIVGTHALIQDKVEYKNLALAVTDEQHRFGVKQRMALMNMNSFVNVLVMSATPIPRTLGLIIYGDLDVSVIKDLPSNRLPIKNTVVGSSYREKLYQFIYKRITEGRQAYVICPMVEEGELDNIENVIDYTEKLRTIFPPTVKIGTLHGKMKAAEKDEIMKEFKDNNLQILVSTTVVEVGVNVPNATAILIENAERFGLASLHQLRGRVGRGEHQSYCMFLCSTDSEKALKKLEILGKSNDGFEIASEDLKQRGPGDFFGLKQSGLPEFKIADIYTDSEVLKIAKELSSILLNDNQNLIKVNEIIKNREDASLIDFHEVCL